MLVHRPSQELLRYKGYSIYIKSDNPLEDTNKFDLIATEARLIFEHVTKELLK